MNRLWLKLESDQIIYTNLLENILILYNFIMVYTLINYTYIINQWFII